MAVSLGIKKFEDGWEFTLHDQKVWVAKRSLEIINDILTNGNHDEQSRAQRISSELVTALLRDYNELAVFWRRRVLNNRKFRTAEQIGTSQQIDELLTKISEIFNQFNISNSGQQTVGDVFTMINAIGSEIGS